MAWPFSVALPSPPSPMVPIRAKLSDISTLWLGVLPCGSRYFAVGISSGIAIWSVFTTLLLPPSVAGATLVPPVPYPSRALTSAGAWYESNAWDANKFLVYATPRDGVPLDQVQDAVERVVAEIAKDGPTEQELDRAKHKVVASTVHAQDNQASLARIFAE